MYRLVTALLCTLAVSSLLAAPAARKTKIPQSLQAAIDATRHKVEPDGKGYQARNPEQNLDLRFNAAAATIRQPDAEVRLRQAGLAAGVYWHPNPHWR